MSNKAKDKCRRVTITPLFSKADTVECEAHLRVAIKLFAGGAILLLLEHLDNERLLMTQGILVTRMMKIEERFGFCGGGKADTAVYWNMCQRTPDSSTANLC